MAVIELTVENFDAEVLQSETPVLVDFWASWCGPCRMLSPVVDEIAEETDTIKVCKVNVDEQPELATTFEISVIPTLVAMRDGGVLAKRTGVMPKDAILKMLGL